MKKILIFILCAALWLPACKSKTSTGSDQVAVQENTTAAKEFCGVSSSGPCKDNSECKAGGCSGQVCYAASEGEPITTCEYRDCYNAKAFRVECRCVDDKCQWK
jgi:eight-cysteine-cluster-containing protein